MNHNDDGLRAEDETSRTSDTSGTTDGADTSGTTDGADTSGTADASGTAPTDAPLGHWLRTVDLLITRELAAALASEHIGRHEWMLLNVLDGGVRLPAFAERLARRGKRLRSLADRGWIREQGDGSWSLTDEGRAAKTRMDGIVADLRARVAGAVSPEDYTTMVASLRAIARELGGAAAADPRGGDRGEDAPAFGPGLGFGRGFRPGFARDVGRDFAPGLRRGFGPFGPTFGPGFPFRARCQAVWSHAALFGCFSFGRLIPTVPAGVGVFGRVWKRSGCASK